jgi:hypothetical protein
LKDGTGHNDCLVTATILEVTLPNAQDINLAQAIAKFSEYGDEIESVFGKLLMDKREEISQGPIRCILNREATSALQCLVPVDVRKQAGIFFTKDRHS